MFRNIFIDHVVILQKLNRQKIVIKIKITTQIFIKVKVLICAFDKNHSNIFYFNLDKNCPKNVIM